VSFGRIGLKYCGENRESRNGISVGKLKQKKRIAREQNKGKGLSSPEKRTMSN